MTTAIHKWLTTLCLMAAAGIAVAKPTVVVGGKSFTEQQVIAEMTALVLKNAGFDVDKRVDMGSSVLRAAQENGQVDVYWEYTGTALVIYNKVQERLDRMGTYERVKSMDEPKGLIWLNPSEANNTYAFAMRKEQAAADNIVTLSDLAATMNQGSKYLFASNAEFYSRSDGLKPLHEMYGFEFPRSQIKRMDGGLTYQALRDQQVDVALVLATDGRIQAFDFVLLEDDKSFFPSYALTPVIRADVLAANPEIADLLNALSAKLDSSIMSGLNAEVDVQRKSVESVAENFLKENGLL